MEREAMTHRHANHTKALGGLLAALTWLALGALPAQAANTVTTVTYVYTNAQGTPLAKADAQGDITARYTYRPYGTQQSGPTNDGPGYTGHVHDPATGLVYMQQRYYDPAIGRFISPDPVGPTPGNVFNFNRYAYANNNPIVNIDPFGLYACGSKVSDTDCQKIDAYVDKVHKSLAGLDKSSREFSRLHKIAKFIGSKNDGNGVTFTTAQLDNGSMGTPGGLKTIKLDIGNIEGVGADRIKARNSGMSSKTAKVVAGGSTVAHETQHLLDALQKVVVGNSYGPRGFPTSKGMEKSTERNAYQIEGIYGRGLGVDVGYSTPAAINTGVKMSTGVWCTSHVCN